MKKIVNIIDKTIHLKKLFFKEKKKHENHHMNHHEKEDELDDCNDPINWTYN